MRLIRKIGLIAVCLTFAVSLRAQTVRVAAAADLQFAMNDVAGRYEKESGKKVEVSYGSSGNFRTQIENGARRSTCFSPPTCSIRKC
jgi:molybdate transport system substrate-binding protein